MIKVLIKENDHILLVPVPNQASWKLKDLSNMNELNPVSYTHLTLPTTPYV